MDQAQYSTLWEAVRNVPDPRRARGRRYPWSMLLAILCAGLASDQKTIWAIASWARLHGRELRALLGMETGRIPSPATLYRAVQSMAVEVLEALIGAHGATLQAPTKLQALAVDGKELRGASKHGPSVRLVSLVTHQQGSVVGQVRVPEGTNELGALSKFLEGQSLQGQVLTMDAIYTTRALAQQVLGQGGHYFMAVKGNQPWLREALEVCFRSAPLPGERRNTYKTSDKGHGRIETRRVVVSNGLNGYLDWPGLQQVGQRTCTRQLGPDAPVTSETSYVVTSLPANEVPVELTADLWRKHWVVENKLHYVRDETMREDRNQMYQGNSPQVLAALRNGVLTVFRAQGFKNMAEAMRTHAAWLPWSLEALGILGPQQPALQDLPTYARL